MKNKDKKKQKSPGILPIIQNNYSLNKHVLCVCYFHKAVLDSGLTVMKRQSPCSYRFIFLTGEDII